jgi:hypothetical protein
MGGNVNGRPVIGLEFRFPHKLRNVTLPSAGTTPVCTASGRELSPISSQMDSRSGAKDRTFPFTYVKLSAFMPLRRAGASCHNAFSGRPPRLR